VVVHEAEEEFEGLSSDVQETFQRIGAGGESGDVADAMGGVLSFSAQTAQMAQYGGVIGGGLATVAEAVGGEGATKLYESLTSGEVTGESIVGALSDKDIQNLARSGHKALAAKAARAKVEKDPEKKKQLEAEVMSQVSKLGEARKEKEEELSEAQGDEAEDLKKDDESLAAVQSEMAEAFKDFKPAVKKFSEGADMLQKAMESDMVKKMIEGD